MDRYREFQEAQRPRRVDTMGGVVTMLVLSTFDLGLNEVASPVSSPRSEKPTLEPDLAPDVVSLRPAPDNPLDRIVAGEEPAERGYALVA
jgi:hypothetical protein